MSLSGQQYKRLQNALVSAFPTKASLKRMLLFELDQNLEVIAKGDNLQDIVLNLILTAEAEGWLVHLVRAARQANPGNLQLQAIVQELLPPSSSPDIVTGDSTQTASFQNEYCEWLIRKCQNYRTEGLSQIGSLLLSNVFVPLKVAANYPKNARPEMIRLRDYEINSQTIWDFLVAAAGDTPNWPQRSIVVLGAPGAGKSTLLKHLTFVYANIEQKKYSEKAPELVPVLLLIREVYKKIVKKQPRLADLIAEQVILTREENQTPQLLSEGFSRELQQGRCLVMLDGLDEVADKSQRKLVSEWVDKQIERYHKNIGSSVLVMLK
jgi:predicted NACHT family NTPase